MGNKRKEVGGEVDEKDEIKKKEGYSEENA